MSRISDTLRVTLLSLKQISDRVKSLILSLFDFRSTLMGDNGTTRIRPLVVAKIVDSGTEHCGFMAQVSNEDKQVFYDGVTPDVGFMFTATKSEGLLSASEGQIDSFPLGVKSGAEAFYPIANWHVCTQAPQDITSAASTWQTAVIQVGEVWRCKEEYKYYNSSEEYIGSVYVYEKVGNSEVTLGEVKAAVDNIDTSDLAKEATLGDVASVLDYIEQGGMPSITAIAKQGSNANATLSDTQAQATSAATDAAAAKQAAQGNSALIGTPATGQPSTIFAAIAASGGGPATALETEVEAGKAAIVDAIEDKGGTASTAMSLTGLAQAIDSIQVPTLLRLNAITFEISASNPIIDMGAIEVLNANSLSFANNGTVRVVRNLPSMPNLTSLSSLFSGCVSLEEVDFTGFDTQNITTFASLFNGCSSLEEVDLRMLDLYSIVAGGMNGIFTNCPSLKKVNIHGLRAVGNFYNFFYNGTTAIKWVDMTDFDASLVTAIADVFQNTLVLETLVGDYSYQDVVDNNIKVLNGLNVGFNTRLGQSTQVSRASLRALFNGLADRTGQSALTLSSIGATNLARLSAEDIAVATSKNWNVTA